MDDIVVVIVVAVVVVVVGCCGGRDGEVDPVGSVISIAIILRTTSYPYCLLH